MTTVNCKSRQSMKLPASLGQSTVGHFSFRISLSLSPKFGLRPKISQKVKSFFVWSQRFCSAKSLRPNFGLNDH